MEGGRQCYYPNTLPPRQDRHLGISISVLGQHGLLHREFCRLSLNDGLLTGRTVDDLLHAVLFPSST